LAAFTGAVATSDQGSTSMCKVLRSLVVAIAAAVVFVLPAWAVADPSQLVKAVTAEVVEIVNTKTGAHRDAAIHQVLRNNFDWPYMARAALGTHWNEASEQQRARFLAALESTESAAYTERLAKLAGYALTIEKVVSLSNGAWTVDSLLTKVTGQPIRLEWEVRDSGQGPRIADVKVAGISMFQIKRLEFSSYIQASGGAVEPLVRALEVRAAR
jgi:phospholipid transport system substrate-binding protein